jgi:hypothetical protein
MPTEGYSRTLFQRDNRKYKKSDMLERSYPPRALSHFSF